MDENKKQRNSEYIGVDEKYIPEEEKYVDESLIGDREKSRKRARRVGKGYIIGVATLMICALVVMAFMVMRSKIEQFNFFYESSSGVESEIGIESLLDRVMQNNSTEDRQITVIYGSSSTSAIEEINNIKNTLSENDDNNDYKVTLDYDKRGYVNKITITDM